MTQVVSLNPATGGSRALDRQESSPAEVALLCERAASAAANLAARPLAWRQAMLYAIADELESDGEVLIALAMEETALPKARLEGELRRTAFQLRFFANVVADGAFLAASIDHAGDSPMGPLPDLRRMRVPLGPVAVFGSSNFPFAFSVPGGDTSSALAAGCPVVIKAHPAHPATSERCFDAMLRGARNVDAPEGVLGLVFGLEAGVSLVDDPAISAVGFTGSVAAGRSLWSRANSRPVPIPFFGELGSANPLVVTARAAAERSIEIGVGIGSSMTLGVGQFCTKPGLLFVPQGEYGDALVAELVASLRELAPMTMLAPGIASHFRDGAHAVTVVSGTNLLVGGDLGAGTSVTPQLLEVAAPIFAGAAARALREECFGPLAVVVRYATGDELAQALDVADPALTFSFFTAADDPDASWLAELGRRKAGRVIANGYPTGVGVSWSMQHGGPWPATTAPSSTSVGAAGIERWLRPVTYQNMPAELLPEALRDENPLGVPQRVDGAPH
jgi:NADP-dependent aldehyde dehydrogenase